MIKLFHIDKVYPSNVTALADVSLEIRKGDFSFIAGPSGAGKTTLLKLIFGIEKPSRGEIVVKGVNLNKIRRSRIAYLRRSIGFVFQDFKLLAHKTAFENVAFVLQIIGHSSRDIRKKVSNALQMVGLEERQDSFPLSMSGGEQQRVAIARAIVNDPLILLADEPTGNLDAYITSEIMNIFKNINARGTTVLFATHNRDLATRYSTKVFTFDRGKRVN
jgi:cell division transport system ATP-binding protein